jgi:helix-turn-helix protein
VTGALVSLEAARTELGIPRTTAYRLLKVTGELAPGLPGFRIGGLWKFNRHQLDRFKAGGEMSRAAS